MNTVTPTHLGGRNGNGVTWKIVIQEEYTFLLRYHSPLFIFSLYLQQRKKQQQLISSLPTTPNTVPKQNRTSLKDSKWRKWRRAVGVFAVLCSVKEN